MAQTSVGVRVVQGPANSAAIADANPGTTSTPATGVIDRGTPLSIGYARVSTTGQSLDRQIDTLLACGVQREHIFADHGVSGRKASRPELDAAMRALSLVPGSTLVIPALDRLGRDTKNTLVAISQIEEMGCHLRIANLDVSTSSPSGRLLVTLVAAIAECEASYLRERVLDGLAAARSRGRVGGRPSVMTDQMISYARTLVDQGESYAAIGRALGVSERTVRRRVCGVA